jgi:hypothetical protein
LVGSLAVAYHFFGQDEDRLVRTKDVDCLLCPHNKAQESGKALATKMLQEGCRFSSFSRCVHTTPSPRNSEFAIHGRR